MQSDLDSISQWSSDTELFFNKSKFAHICFWSKPSFIDLPEYNINSKTISKVVKIKDLGIILSSNLNWDYHYKNITGRAYKFLGLLRRTFTTDSILAKKRLYIYIHCKITTFILFTSVASLLYQRYFVIRKNTKKSY